MVLIQPLFINFLNWWAR